MIDKIKLGKFIKSRRKVFGYSLESVAEKANTSKSYVWEIENGRKGISYDLACRLSEVLDFNLDVAMKRCCNN